MYANVCPVNRNLPVHTFVNPNLQCAALKPFPLANGATRNHNHLCFGYQFVVLDVLMVLQTNLLFGCLTYSFIYSLDTVKAKIIASLSDSTLAYPAMPPHFVESFSTLGFSAVPAKWGYWTQRLKAVWREQTSTGRSWSWAMTWSAQDCTRFKIWKNNFSVPTIGSNNWNNFSIENMRSISKQKSPQAINTWAEYGATPSNSWGSNFVVRGPSLMATQSWYVDEGCPILHTH